MTAVSDILVATGRLSPADLGRAVAAAGRAGGGTVDELLVELGLISARDRADATATALGLRLVQAQDLAGAAAMVGEISPNFLRQARVLPFADSAEGLLVAMAEPSDHEAIEAIRLATGRPVVPCVAVPADLELAIERLYGGGRTALQRIVDDLGMPAETTAAEDLDRLKDLASEAPVVRLVNHLIDEAIRLRASDIHIEPFPGALTVRYRIDGMLQDLPPPPARLARAVVSRIKILAHLNIAERRLPQDGRITYSARGGAIDLRIATLPTVHGESAVIRLLDPSVGARRLSGLGLAAGDEAAVRRLLEIPNGMVLVTGPTGSGKTTTLYAALGLVDAARRKVLTVEDPVEYHLPRVNQVQVKPSIGLGFANVLRALVRQDPDVIMIGELRDRETAEIAVHAALTGHLVLTTLHTNSAAGAVARLLDMGVEPFLLTSTVRAVVGERLVRVLCPRCRQPAPVPPEVARALQDRLVFPDGVPTELPVAVGCDHCSGTGYHGRVGIFELLTMTDEIRRLTEARAGSDAIELAARRTGMVTLYEDGLRKVAAGVTSLAEVCRVTDRS